MGLRRLLGFHRPEAVTGATEAVAPVPPPSSIENEHFVPAQGLELETYLAAEDICGIHHLGRYRWAVEVLKERKPSRVLDIACGAGYGSWLLAESLPQASVTGADYDELGLHQSRELYARSNLAFAQADATQLDLGKFDAIVSFDTIEHVVHRELMMQSLVESLTENGCLLLSTPVASETKRTPEWEHHRIEYSFTALYDFLRRYFRVIGSANRGTLPCQWVFDEIINRGRQRYCTQMNPVVCEGPIRIPAD